MTPEYIANRWLSFQCWMMRTVFPAAFALVIVLGLLWIIGPDQRTLDHTATLVGFSALYFILFRGGHLIMIRSLHSEMMRKHEEAYREKLALITDVELKRKNLGFTLAKVKRDILVEARKPKF